MYKLGHYGTALAFFTPVATGLIAIGQVQPAIVGWVIAVGISTLPDIDRKLPFLEHRGMTHTVWFVAAGSLIIGVITGSLFGSPLAFGYGTLIGTIGLGSHLVADVLTPSGIRPLMPVIETKYTFSITKARNPIANYLLLGAGMMVAATGLWIGYAI